MCRFKAFVYNSFEFDRVHQVSFFLSNQKYSFEYFSTENSFNFIECPRDTMCNITILIWTFIVESDWHAIAWKFGRFDVNEGICKFIYFDVDIGFCLDSTFFHINSQIALDLWERFHIFISTRELRYIHFENASPFSFVLRYRSVRDRL